MIDCLIIGDSIAQGVSHLEPKCSAYTQIGISPKSFTTKFLNKYDHNKAVTIISLGSNNPGSKSELKNNLEKVRTPLQSKRIIWILPNNPALKAQVIDIANHFNDSYVEFEVSKDNVHPKSYKALNQSIQNKLNN